MSLSLVGRTGICRRSRRTTCDVIVSGCMWADWLHGIDVRCRNRGKAA